MTQTIDVELRQLDPRSPDYAVAFVERLLSAAQSQRASDVHFQPTPEGLEVRWRIDGVLQPLGTFASGESVDIVHRLKAMAELLTYRSDLPQEGRLAGRDVEIRVSTFPTLHGERAAVRLFASRLDLQRLEQLSLPAEILGPIQRLLQETAGALVVTGPAGSGKTTTLYAALRELAAASPARCILSIEDPVEAAIPGVAQAEVNEPAGLTLARGVRGLLRQDPEVLMIGEIRDPETAWAAMSASLTGHLVLTTLHAGLPATALRRLVDMGVEPYVLRSAVRGVLSQRLARRLCDCRLPVADPAGHLGLPLTQAWQPGGCSDCWGTGYRGRLVLAELLLPEQHGLTVADIASCTDAELQAKAERQGLQTLYARALQAAATGETSPQEIRRLLGWADGS